MSGGTDRYTARVDYSYLNSLETRGSKSHKGDDTYRLVTAGTPKRYSAKQIAAQREQLSERDQAILRDLKHYRLATSAQLQRLHFHNHASLPSGQRVTRKTLNRLTTSQLLVRLERRIGGIKAGSSGHIYCLSPIGHRVLGSTTRKRLYEPSAHHVRHTLAITELATSLIELQRTLLLDDLIIEGEPNCWRTSTAMPTLKPDLYVRLVHPSVELSWFIEVDCATESSTVLRRKLAAYADYWHTGTEQADRGVFPRTLWIAPDSDRAAFIEELIYTTPSLEPELFAVTTTDKAISTLLDFDDTDRRQP